PDRAGAARGRGRLALSRLTASKFDVADAGCQDFAGDDMFVCELPDTGRRRLDELDRRIIEALQENGRVPFLQLARELGVSEATIRNRYQRLCESDFLQVVGVTNPLALGFDSSALVGVRVSGSPMDVAEELAGWKEASYVVVTAGQFDVLVELICSDRLHLM